MLNCKQNTELLSQALERPITLGEKISMRLHLLMCRGCRNFDKQLHFIHKAARQFTGKI